LIQASNLDESEKSSEKGECDDSTSLASSVASLVLKGECGPKRFKKEVELKLFSEV